MPIVDTVSVVEGSGVDVDANTAAPALATGYRPWLDGLRAIAVYLVVLFHAGNGKLTGGYVGVDIFFVLSGYLVTQLLLRDVAGRGGIRFARFYSRRYRRLLPAAFVALIVTAIVFVAIASPVEVADSAGSFKAAFLYVTNWYFIHHASGYFGANIAANPVLQFWSLAIEEQFYLLWPLVLGGLFLATRRLDPVRRTQLIAAIVAVGAVMSAVWALTLRHTDPNHAYYGTDTRAYELLAGALLALVPALLVRAARSSRAARVAASVSLVALVVLASSWTHLDAIERGVAVTLVTCVFLVGVEAAQGGIVQRALSHPTVVYLGRISYGTYLWHWIVILVAIREFHLGSTTTLIVLLVSTALASLSFQVLEHPVRASALLDRHRGAVIATGLAVSIVSAAVLVPRIVDAGRAASPALQGDVTGLTRVPELDWRAARGAAHPFVNCYRKPVADCTVVHGTTGPHLLLIGDSHADMLVPTFSRIARDTGGTLSVAVRGGCPWQEHLSTLDVHGPQGTFRAIDCRQMKDDLYDRVVTALHPDVIVAVDSPYENPRQLLPFVDDKGRVLNPRAPRDMAQISADSAQSVDRLTATGARVVLIEPLPVPGVDTLDCLSKATYVEQCRYVASTFPDQLELTYRRIANQSSSVWSVDIDRLVCPYLPICDPIVDSQIVRRDGTHLTAAFAQSIAPEVERYLRQVRALPG